MLYSAFFIRGIYFTNRKRYKFSKQVRIFKSAYKIGMVHIRKWLVIMKIYALKPDTLQKMVAYN
jgi:hypothetical protein